MAKPSCPNSEHLTQLQFFSSATTGQAKTPGACECALILNLPADWLGRFWQTERTDVVLGVHCLDSWVLPQNCGTSLPLPVKNTLGLHQCYVTFISEKTLSTLMLVRALVPRNVVL